MQINFALLIGIVLLAGFSYSEKAVSQTSPGKPGGITWQESKPGVKILRLWKIAPDDTGVEKADLILSPAAHTEFHKNPKDFINRYKVFSADVRTMDACLRFAPASLPGVPDCGCNVRAIHYTRPPENYSTGY